MAFLLDGLAESGQAMYPSRGDLGVDEASAFRPMAEPIRSAGDASEADHSVHSVSSGAVALIIAPFARCWSAMRRHNARRRTEAALDALDDRTLKDIGYSRYEIECSRMSGRRRHNGLE